MKERPILSSAPTVRAMIAGTKTQAEERFRAMSQEQQIRTLLRYHEALSDLATWREGCRDYDADMGYPERDADEDMVDAMMARAREAAEKGNAP